MSGETEQNISGWTTDTLHAHVAGQVDDLRESMDSRFADLRLNLRERFEAQTKAVEVGFTAQTTAMQTAFIAADRAVQAALVAQEKATTTAFTAADKAVDKALEAAKEAVDQRASTLDREFHEHLDQVRHENALAFLNSDKAIQAAFASSKEAITKAELAADKRFEGVNEFRAQLADQAATFISRAEAEARLNALGEKSDGGIARNAERLAMLELAMQKVPTATEKDAAHAALAARASGLADRMTAMELALSTLSGQRQGSTETVNDRRASTNTMVAVVGALVSVLLLVIGFYATFHK